jgi:hypothetical protein
MPPTPAVPGSVRPASVVNENIRALWARTGGTLGPAERDEYHRLLVEWAAAVRAEQATAQAA